jgi:hypothetical protein
MSKQTAVEWYRNTFFKALQEGLTTSESEIFEQAKAMEREQIATAYQSDRTPCSDEDAEQYYNETYGGEQ